MRTNQINRVFDHFPTYRIPANFPAYSDSYLASPSVPCCGSGVGSYVPAHYENPVPYTDSDIGEPVPGWGVSLQNAGPRWIGIGAPTLTYVGKTPTSQRYNPVTMARTQPAGSPWWIWPAVTAVAIGGYVAYKKGML